MDKSWYIFFADHHQGPYSTREVRSFFRRGQLTTSTPLWREDFSQWHLLKDIPEFQERPAVLSSINSSNISPHIPPTLTYKEKEKEIPKQLNMVKVEAVEMGKEVDRKKKIHLLRAIICCLLTVLIFNLIGWKYFLNSPSVSSSLQPFTPKVGPDTWQIDEKSLRNLKRVSQLSSKGPLELALAITQDSSQIWMSSNWKGPIDFELRFKGINGKVLSKDSVAFFTTGRLENHWSSFEKFYFEKGASLVPGHYQLELKWIAEKPLLIEGTLSSTGKLTRTAFLGNLSPEEFLVRLEAFNAEQIEKELGQLKDILERFQTMVVLMDQLEDLFQNELKMMVEGGDVKKFIQDYTRSFAPLLSELVMGVPSYSLSPTTTVKGMQLEKELVFHREQGKKLGLSIMEMVEKIKSMKVLDAESKKDLFLEFREKISPIRKSYSQKITQISG